MGILTPCLKCLIVSCNVLLAIIGFVIVTGTLVLVAGNQKYVTEFLKSYYNKSMNSGEVENDNTFSQPNYTDFSQPNYSDFSQPNSTDFNQSNSTDFNQSNSSDFNESTSTDFSQSNSPDFSQSNSPDFNQSNTEPPADFSDLDFSEFIRPIAIVLVVFGSILTVIGVVGVYGVCCKSRFLLVTYAAVVIVIVVAEIVVSVLFFVKMFDKDIRIGVKRTLTEDYIGIDDKTSYSLAWNYLMIEHKCCGVDGYEDFETAKKWDRNKDVLPGIEINSSMFPPVACCKAENRKDREKKLSCVLNPSEETSNWKTGCWKTISATLEPYRTMAVGIVCAIIVGKSILALMAIAIAWTIHKSRKDF